MVRWLPFAAACLGACGFTPDYSGTSFQCPDGESCPPGFDCLDGVCVGLADAGAPESDDDGDEGPGTGEDVPCGASIAAIDDSFADGEVGPLWSGLYASGDARYEERGGEAELHVGPGGEVGLATGCGHDATGASITLEKLDLDHDDAAIAFLRLTRSTTELASLSVGDGSVVAQVLAPGSDSTQTLDAHEVERYYRIREDDGFFAFEASVVGVGWRTMTEIPAPFEPDDVQVSFGARSLGDDVKIEVDRVYGDR